MTEPLQKKYGIPVFLDHDVQSVALLEQLYGSGKDYQDMLVSGWMRGWEAAS